MPVLAYGVGLAALAALLTGLTRLYALRRGLMDAPGERRSHQIATPRGGGIAIVAVVLLGCVWQAWNADAGQGTPIVLFAVGFALVAGIGWLDDHRPLSARLRFSIHLIAAVLLAIALWRLGYAIWLVVAGFVLAASLINIWNFMDGINGLAASQAAIAAAGFALVLPSAWSLLALTLCAGCLGFLPFNFPRARIFLGDVGSGALGYALAALTAVAAAQAASPILVLLPLTMFSVDAGFTLSRRVLSREPWWQPHTTHAYQRTARRLGHTRVTAACAIFTLTATIMMVMSWHWDGWSALVIAATCFAFASWTWVRLQARTGFQG